MNTFYYIKKIKIISVEDEQTESPLTSENGYSVGTTWEDAQHDKFVLLNSDQVAFHLNNPYATAKEVWNCALIPPHIPTLEEVIAKKVNDIKAYDTSLNVNEFYVNGMSLWFPKEERIALKNRIDTEAALSIENTKVWLSDMVIEMPVENMRNLLLVVEKYAIESFDVTNYHMLQVKNLLTKEEVEQYDITTGYPEKISINLE